MVYFCYVDESGTPQIPGNTSHYILCGISIPVKDWKKCDSAINKIKAKYLVSRWPVPAHGLVLQIEVELDGAVVGAEDLGVDLGGCDLVPE